MKEKPTPASHLTALISAVNDAKTPLAIVAIVALVLVLAACAVDTDRVARTRADLLQLCQGAITLPLKAACARAGIDTTPALVVPSAE